MTLRVLFCSSAFTEKVCWNWARSAVAPGTYLEQNQEKQVEEY